MYFIIFKTKDKLTSYTNEIFKTEKEAADYAKRSLKRKDTWEVVPLIKRTTINIGINNYRKFLSSCI